MGSLLLMSKASSFPPLHLLQDLRAPVKWSASFTGYIKDIHACDINTGKFNNLFWCTFFFSNFPLCLYCFAHIRFCENECITEKLPILLFKYNGHLVTNLQVEKWVLNFWWGLGALFWGRSAPSLPLGGLAFGKWLKSLWNGVGHRGKGRELRRREAVNRAWAIGFR